MCSVKYSLIYKMGKKTKSLQQLAIFTVQTSSENSKPRIVYSHLKKFACTLLHYLTLLNLSATRVFSFSYFQKDTVVLSLK